MLLDNDWSITINVYIIIDIIFEGRVMAINMITTRDFYSLNNVDFNQQLNNDGTFKCEILTL